MILKEISREEFNNLPNLKKLLCNEEFPRKFALLSVKSGFEPLALCWQSEIVEPQIVDDEQSPLLWFGVDQQIVALKKSDGRVALTLLLQSNLLELLLVRDSVVLRTEFEIYSFSLDGIFQLTYSLPEISESIQIKSNVLNVTMIDGRSIDLRI